MDCDSGLCCDSGLWTVTVDCDSGTVTVDCDGGL